MDSSPGTVFIFFILIFGTLEFAVVIIPSMINRSKSRTNLPAVYDIPHTLSTPVSAEQSVRLRSWYFDQDGPNFSGKRLSGNNFTAASVMPVGCHAAGHAADRAHVIPGPVSPPAERARNWKEINKASWAVQKRNAEKAAELAHQMAGRAIFPAEDEDWEPMDFSAAIGQQDFPGDNTPPE